MKTALVLILSPADVAALPTCAAELRAAGAERLWLIHSPALGVSNETTLKSFADRIAEVKRSEAAAAARGDYESAKNFKTEAETIALDQSRAVRDGWHSVPESDRIRAYDTALAPLLSGFKAVSITTLREDYQPDGIFGMLQGLLVQWPVEIPKDEYSLVWPNNCTEVARSSSGPSVVENKQVTTQNQVSAPTPVSANDIPDDLASLTYFDAQKLAKGFGFDAHKKKLPEILGFLTAKKQELSAVAA